LRDRPELLFVSMEFHLVSGKLLFGSRELVLVSRKLFFVSRELILLVPESPYLLLSF
jgi:hypothetical protein